MTLPPSIFDNTQEGMDEAAKDDLLTNGVTDYWEISAEDPDSLIISPRFFNDRAIGLHLFRNTREGGAVAAIGTLGEPACSLELWRVDAAGRVVPIDAPPEPAPGEFFKKSRRAQRNNHYTVLLCLANDRLQAQPLIWQKGEMRPANVDKKIFFTWNGEGFEKHVEALK